MASRKKSAVKRTGKKTVAQEKAELKKAFATLNDALTGRYRFMQRAGIQYEGRRDTYKVAGYVKQGEVKFSHYWGLYKRGDVAGRIVDMPPKTTWRTPPEIVEEDHEDGTPFTNEFMDLSKRLKLWRMFERADRLAGVGEYSVLTFGIANTAIEQLRLPLVRAQARDLIYLSVYNQGNADIESWITDTGDPRFGMPGLYKLGVSTGNTKNFLPQSDLTVHSSRCLHIAEDLLEDEVFGRPRLERALNRLFDLDKVAAATGEAYWQSAVRILQGQVDSEAEIGDADTILEQMQAMTHDLQRHFLGQGIQLSWLPTDTPNPGQVIEMYFSLIAAASGIPKRILFGSEMGELASSTDQATYFGTINERQEQFAEPMIVRAFIDRMIELGVLPEPTTGEYQVVWPNLFEESETEKADANLKRAQTASALTPVGGDPRELVEITPDTRDVWLLPQTQDEAEELREQNEMPPVEDPDPEGDDVTDPNAEEEMSPADGEEIPPMEAEDEEDEE